MKVRKISKFQQNSRFQSVFQNSASLMNELKSAFFKEIPNLFLQEYWNPAKLNKNNNFKTCGNSASLMKLWQKTANFKEIQSFQKIVIIQANIFWIWLKSEWSERSISVVLDQFEAFSVRRSANILSPGNFVEFQELFETSEIGVKKLYFQRLVYFWIFVGFTCKVYFERG